MRNDYDRDNTSVSTKLTYLLVGGGIGAVIALLFAPKSGVEKGRETATQLQEKAGEYYEVSREKANELYQTGREKAGEFTEKARSAAAQSVNPFTAAVEAGKEAYISEKRKSESKAITEGRPSYPVDGEEKS